MQRRFSQTTHRFVCPRGLTLLETAVSLVLIAVLLSILLPALSIARVASYRDQCQSNQRKIGQAWQMYLEDNNREFPYVPVQPGWLYGGMRFSSVGHATFPDQQRPLTPYLPLHRTSNYDEVICCCPADRGLTDPHEARGPGKRTVFRSWGTSYRANAALLDASITGASADARGMRRSEITTAPSRLVLMGDAVWYEAAEATGLQADWHGVPSAGNLLFLDGSVRFMTIRSKKIVGPIVFDPIMPGTSAAGAVGAPATMPDVAVPQ